MLLFGGAFNPPHIGHEALLRAAMDEIQPDLTVIMPSATSPHKKSGDTKFAHRAAMARSFKKLGNLKVSEIENAGRKKRNFTIQTIKRLKKIYPDYRIYLLIGSDMLESFSLWSRFRRILSMATLVVASREEDEEEMLRKSVAQVEKDGGSVILLKTSPVVVSSSELRGKLKRKEDVFDLLDENVANYIVKHGLYR